MPGSVQSVFYVLCRSATVYLKGAYRTNRELLTQCCKSTLQSAYRVHDTLMLNRSGPVSTQGKLSEGKDSVNTAYFRAVRAHGRHHSICILHMYDEVLYNT